MRRTLPLLLAAAVVFTACGGDDAASTETSADATADSSDDAGAGDTADDDESTSGDDLSDDSTADDSTAGDSSDDASEVADDETSIDDTVPEPQNPDKPDVAIPDEIPEELEITVLTAGDGPEIAAGDTAVIDYVGVRSADGVEFDNSYDRFEPIIVTVGTGGVIEGWDQGLIGAQAGSQIQLDIPSDLAYGEEARSELIGANEALTFVLDVRQVIGATDDADAPTADDVTASEGATEVEVIDLTVGDGDELEPGQTGVVNYTLFRGDTLEQLESNWGIEPVPLPTGADSGVPGIAEGLPGAQIGGRRVIVMPPDFGFGAEGNAAAGLPEETDLIIVVDLLAIY